MFMANDSIIRNSEDAVRGEAYFYSLCRPAKEKKKRNCLRCRVSFKSEGLHHRKCANCNRVARCQSTAN